MKSATDGGRSLAIVFVHGINSSPNAWTHMIDVVTHDEALANVQVHNFAYHTSIFGLNFRRKIPSLDHVADHLYTWLRFNVPETEVVLATHSQGGLVALRLLARYVATGNPLPDLPDIRSLVMYACPHAGSKIAWTTRRAFLWGNAQEKSLRPLDEATAESIRTVLTRVSAKAAPLERIRVVAVAGSSDGVVSPSSAKGLWPESETVPGDHSTIILPTSKNDLGYQVLRRVVSDLAKAPSEVPRTEKDARDSDRFWRELAEEVARRLPLDEWDAALGGLVRTERAMRASVHSDLHEFGGWLLGRIYPPGHEDIARVLDTLGTVLRDLLTTFNRHTEMVHGNSEDSWISIPRWYNPGRFNPNYDEDAQEYTEHTDLLTDLALELTRATDWFCDQVRTEIDPTWRLSSGGLVLLGGPYSDGDTRYLRPMYTTEERETRPSPYTGLANFRDEMRYTRDYHTHTEGEEPAGPAEEIMRTDRELLDEQVAELEQELEVYRAWKQRGGRDELTSVLGQGVDSGLLSQMGLRCPIWGTDLHLRFTLDESAVPVITIETHGGCVLRTATWSDEQSTLDMFRSLNQEMKETGHHLGPGLFSPAESIRTCAEAVGFAAGYRAQELNVGAQNFKDIIEYVDGWYISEAGLFSREHPQYFIDRRRLKEMDWVEHVSAKGWYGIATAMEVADRLLADS